jgi:type IV pilus modification protein PilV
MELVTIRENVEYRRREIVMAPYRIRRERGFSLIETSVAICLLIVGFLGVSGLVLASINGNAYNRNLAMADNLSANLMEFWKSAGYSKVQSFLAGCGTGCTARTYATESTPAYNDALLNSAITAWKQQIVDHLPSGRGVVVVTKSATTPFQAAWVEVTVQWVQKGKVYNAKKRLYRADI